MANVVEHKTYVSKDGVVNHEIIINHTSDDGSEEALLTDLPSRGRVVRFSAFHNSGSAANFQPEIGLKSGFLTNGVDTAMLVASTPVATVIDEYMNQFRYYPSPSDSVDTDKCTLYYRTNCDAGSDNSVTSLLLIEEV